jgi:ABC-2 type transport system ATP-binding protein
MPAAILTQGLTKIYGKRLGIEGLDLEVRSGEIFGFIGPNGAGKTTTIRLLLDLLHPTRGRAEVLGLDSHRQSVEVRQAVGYLPGEFGLDTRTTGRQLIRNFARLRGMQDLGAADRLGERLGVDLDLPTGRLSRGNRQKVGLVQALFHEPALAILDEPTTGLDPLVQDTFLQLLREAKAEGRTVFLSSHILSEVERVCDRVAIVRGGHLAALETTESLLEKRRKRVTLVFASPVDASAFAALPGISDVHAQGATLWMRVGDGIDAVIKLAARYTLLDLSVEHPSLDEVFLGYYDERGNGQILPPQVVPGVESGRPGVESGGPSS